MRRRDLLAAGTLAALGTGTAAAGAGHGGFAPPFPRLMGMNIGAKHYDEPGYQQALARYDVVVLDFFPEWHQGRGSSDPIGDALRALKQLNRKLLIAQYSTVADGTLRAKDRAGKIDGAGWWLRDAHGNRARWTSAYDTFDVNITDWAPPDAEGRRYPEWLVEHDYRLYHAHRPQVDAWYFDNSMSQPLVKRADWDGDGHDDANDDPRIARAFRQGHVRSWRRVRALQPDALIIANTDDLSSPEYAGQLDGAFLEALVGKSWSVESWGGWGSAMRRYQSALANTRAPRLVGFGVVGRADDYRLMRYGLASCLMDDGYFAYSTLENQYGTAPWFDEFDAPLGAPLDPPQQHAWDSAVYRRRFEGGMVLLNPSSRQAEVEVAPGYRHLRGAQEPGLNTGAPAKRITLGAKDGVILVTA